MNIRYASESDVPKILGIYKPYIENSPITFETEVPGHKEFLIRFNNITKVYPWLVCEVNGAVIGYAYASQLRERSAYKWSVELGIYIDESFQGKGIGRALYEKLIEILTEQGFYNAFAGITLPNTASIKLHESLGFTKVGIYKNVGFKSGKWHDVVWYQFALNTRGAPSEIKGLN